LSFTLFIADLHLDPVRPAITELFLDFLAGEARQADALYILGDLFEVWLGDDDFNPHHERVAEGLHALSVAGTPVYFMVGNRDFLLGEAYARRAGMTILEEPVTLDLYGTPTTILHGDVLCTDDRPYQMFRALVRNRAWQKCFLLSPLVWRRMLANMTRGQSRKRGQSVNPDITDVNADAVAAMFRKQDVPRIIHGHTHRPAVHSLEVDDASRKRIVLGDWYEQGSVLRVDEAGADLSALPLQ
jgi:UDP-2,3-diacylglucosamine hydrolase